MILILIASRLRCSWSSRRRRNSLGSLGSITSRLWRFYFGLRAPLRAMAGITLACVSRVPSGAVRL
jgi:hypothetical protein